MRLGVAIVTYGAGDVIARALAALDAQTRRPDRVVLVDNASPDDTLARVHAHPATASLAVDVIASAENLGFAAANNLAVDRLDDCPLVALLNPDAFPAPDWLAQLERAAVAHPEAASFASRLMLAGTPDVLDGAGDVYHASGLLWRRGHGRALAEVPEALQDGPVFSACAAAALYRRVDWQRVGGLDARFFCYAEDVDLGFRLQRQGRTCWYVAGAVAEHVGSASSGVDSPFAVYHGHRNLEWVYLKNMPPRLAWRYAAWHLAAGLAGLATLARRGRLRAYLKAKRDALRQAAEFARERRRTVDAVPASTLEAALDRSSLWRRWRRR